MTWSTALRASGYFLHLRCLCCSPQVHRNQTDTNMSDQANEVQFQFVNSTIDTPSVPQDVATRALIRKQAMKKASAARKRNGSYGKHNLRQFPVFINDTLLQQPTISPESVSEDTSPQDTPSKKEDPPPLVNNRIVPRYTHEKISSAEDDPRPGEIALARSIPTSLPQSAYELMTLKYGINILDLSNLTTFHVSRATRKALLSNPSQVINLLRYNRWSFFSYLQSSYEHNPCVRYAADCVVARVRQILSPSEDRWNSVVISLYVKALIALQKALDCPKQRFSPEVLYATEILALYEVCWALLFCERCC